MPRRSSLRKSKAERPCCQQVRHTDIRTDYALIVIGVAAAMCAFIYLILV